MLFRSRLLRPGRTLYLDAGTTCIEFARAVALSQIPVTVVTNSVEYDNLTREARLVRTRDGHVEKQDATGDDAVIREWMTGFFRMPLFSTTELEPNREYYVRVVATARPTNGVLLWPWGTGAAGQAKFTFLR